MSENREPGGWSAADLAQSDPAGILESLAEIDSLLAEGKARPAPALLGARGSIEAGDGEEIEGDQPAFGRGSTPGTPHSPILAGAPRRPSAGIARTQNPDAGKFEEWKSKNTREEETVLWAQEKLNRAR